MAPNTTPDLADVLAAGRDYPVRDALQPLDDYSARALLLALRQWWLDAAEGYLRLAENGCRESLEDSRRALAVAGTFAPAREAVA